MLEITYLNAAKQEQTITFDSYADFECSQQSCSINLADHYKVVKLSFNGHDLAYSGTYGDIFFYLLKQDLSQFE